MLRYVYIKIITSEIPRSTNKKKKKKKKNYFSKFKILNESSFSVIQLDLSPVDADAQQFVVQLRNESFVKIVRETETTRENGT